MSLTGIESFDELYLAARHSGVPLRKTLLAREKRAADLATAAIRERVADQLSLSAGPGKGARRERS